MPSHELESVKWVSFIEWVSIQVPHLKDKEICHEYKQSKNFISEAFW